MNLLNKILCFLCGHSPVNYTMTLRVGHEYKFVDVTVCKHCVDISTLRGRR